MPKYRVGLYFSFRVDYEVEAAHEAEAKTKAYTLCDLESDPELVTHTTEAIEVVNAIVEQEDEVNA